MKMNNNKYFISKNYKSQFSAAGKGKIDCEKTLERIGFKNIGLPRTIIPNSIIGSIITFFSVLIGIIRLPKKSTLCVIYPTKKYYNLILKVAVLKECKITTIIFDLRSLRKGKLGIKKEINCLNRNTVVISHNEFMSKWLSNNQLKSKIVDLSIFDYLSENKKSEKGATKDESTNFELVFAGILGINKNGFIYDLDNTQPKTYTINLYGIGFDKKQRKENSIIDYKGFFPADEVVDRLEGSFGLVWDGRSIKECSGIFGEYLRINNPHKTSLYLRAGLPIIIWNQAALAKFVTDNNVGIAIDSLENLDKIVSKLNKEQFQEMRANAKAIGEKIGNGHFLETAIKQC